MEQGSKPVVDTLTSGVGTVSTRELRLPGELGLDPEMLLSTSVNRPNITATVRMADETGQPPIKKRRLTNLLAPSKDVVLDMCQRVSQGMRAEEETRRAEIASRSVLPQSTTSTYASHARKYVVFRTGQMSRGEENVDMFLEGLPVSERTREWVEYI